jgi:hypothetical protein
MFGKAPGACRFQRRVQDIGLRRLRGGVAQALPFTLGKKVVVVLGIAGDQSSPS